MKYFVYIIISLKDHSYYKGFSENPYQRVIQHNKKESKYTATKIPWKLVFFQSYLLKSEALKREKVLIPNYVGDEDFFYNS